MPEELALFDILLSTERTETERLDALNSLQPFLATDEAAEKLSIAARNEATVSIRKRMLELLCAIPITRLSQREAYIDTFCWFAALEPERPLRLLAIHQLAALAAHVEPVQEILAETLVNDLDTRIQLECIYGLGNIVHKTPATIELISGFIPLAPAAVKAGLLQLVKQFPLPAAADMAMQFISPLESSGTRLDAISFLATLPAPSTAIISQLSASILTETDVQVRAAIIRLLANLKTVDESLFSGIIAALQRMPDQPELLSILRDRLTAHPELQEQLAQLFTASNAAGLKISLLTLLQHSDIPALLISGLSDNNPYVREAALPYLQQHFARHQSVIEPALITAIREEPLTVLRSELLHVLLHMGRKSAETEAALISLALTETDHRLKIQLAEVATQFAVTPENSQALLQLFREIMEGVYFPAHIKAQVTARLTTYSYSNSPDLKQSLGLMLEQAKDINEVAVIYKLLKTLEADINQLAPAMINVLYRHIAYYPQAPLDEWVQLFGKLAAQDAHIRAELPYIVALTKANWLLSETDKSDQTGAFLPAFKETLLKKNGMQTFMEAERMLNDAWQNRTIKKAEVIALYQMLLSLPKADGILQRLLSIMQTGKLVTPELVQISLDYLLTPIDKDGAYMVRKYLESTGYLDLEYRSRVLALFTQEHFRRYRQHTMPGLHTRKRYNTLNDWEYSGWYNAYNEWPVAELVFAMEPGQIITELYATPPADNDIPEATLQYLVLEHLFRKAQNTWARSIYGNVDALQAFLRQLSENIRVLPEQNGLRDRMVYVFWKKWNDYVRILNGSPVPADLSTAAAEVYIAVCKVQQRLEPDFTGKKFPDILKGMNKDVVHQQWPWNNELWETFEYRHFPKADPDQDAAQQLYQQAAKALQSGEMNKGYQSLKELVAQYAHTKLVKEQMSNINNALIRLEEQMK
ncbi:hypothetical protein [Chitinophaga rhizophila]|uniref:HEAT repeat protein n=1 Tax=Chitinophaga rhizophila TaxID=2866212 RepID=A0ABS7G873_9BACT|nr:hypothetical protein [Chitinophaga rhizophila]MBW8683868.1 hypothetical protein [Chitinophaga rhizophila]